MISIDDLRSVFHPAVYQENAQAVFGDGVWDFAHFLETGLVVGLSPTPYFDPDHVNSPTGETPLIHWLSGTGAQSPHPLVDLDLVGQQFETDGRLEILSRLTAGEGRLLRLHPLFWGSTYVDAHPRGDKIQHPLHHYLKRGWTHGHEPNPFFAGELVPDDDQTDRRAPALRWLDSLDVNLVPTSLFDPETYRRQAGRFATPRMAYLDFLTTGVWQNLRPSEWFTLPFIRSQIAGTNEPAVLTYLRLEHTLEVRPSKRFTPADHSQLMHRPTAFGAKILERWLSTSHNPQFQRRPPSLTPEIAAQLDRLHAISPDAIDAIRAQTELGWIRMNTNDFTSPRLAALRQLESITTTGTDEPIVLLQSGQHPPERGTPVFLDRLLGIDGISERDLAAALAELIRQTRVPLSVGCELGDRVLAPHLKALAAWVPVSSLWPRPDDGAGS